VPARENLDGQPNGNENNRTRADVDIDLVVDQAIIMNVKNEVFHE
jgi:hypothetical protein